MRSELVDKVFRRGFAALEMEGFKYVDSTAAVLAMREACNELLERILYECEEDLSPSLKSRLERLESEIRNLNENKMARALTEEQADVARGKLTNLLGKQSGE